MDILIDNINIEDTWGIKVLDYLPALGFASERTNERVWRDKSGVDKNLENVRYDSRDFTLQFLVKENNELITYEAVSYMVEYMKSKGVFVLTLRDNDRGIRKSFLCERNEDIVPNISVREQNSLYVCRVGFKDVNPNAIVFYETVVGGSVSVDYTKGRIADIYWGNGDRGEVDNSSTYTKEDYTTDEEVTVIIDIDKDNNDISVISADFVADIVNGIKPQDIQFTSSSIGDIAIYQWSFGDGTTSTEENPSHTYTESGTYTVSLQVINEAGGYSTTTKIDYITIRNARLIINDSGDFLKYSDDSEDFISYN